jgi:hypothetical protein
MRNIGTYYLSLTIRIPVPCTRGRYALFLRSQPLEARIGDASSSIDRLAT